MANSKERNKKTTQSPTPKPTGKEHFDNVKVLIAKKKPSVRQNQKSQSQNEN